jgi:hypothetical protein
MLAALRYRRRIQLVGGIPHPRSGRRRGFLGRRHGGLLLGNLDALQLLPSLEAYLVGATGYDNYQDQGFHMIPRNEGRSRGPAPKNDFSVVIGRRCEPERDYGVKRQINPLNLPGPAAGARFAAPARARVRAVLELPRRVIRDFVTPLSRSTYL